MKVQVEITIWRGSEICVYRFPITKTSLINFHRVVLEHQEFQEVQAQLDRKEKRENQEHQVLMESQLV